MEESYIRDYQVNLLENTYSDDLERLKAINYGLEYILNGMEYNLETNEDKSKYNKLTTCLLTINEIIKEEDRLKYLIKEYGDEEEEKTFNYVEKILNEGDK